MSINIITWWANGVFIIDDISLVLRANTDSEISSNISSFKMFSKILNLRFFFLAKVLISLYELTFFILCLNFSASSSVLKLNCKKLLFSLSIYKSLLLL